MDGLERPACIEHCLFAGILAGSTGEEGSAAGNNRNHWGDIDDEASELEY